MDQPERVAAPPSSSPILYIQCQERDSDPKLRAAPIRHRDSAVCLPCTLAWSWLAGALSGAGPHQTRSSGNGATGIIHSVVVGGFGSFVTSRSERSGEVALAPMLSSVAVQALSRAL